MYEKKTTIYALAEPGKPEQIRYIGQTTQKYGGQRRYSQHTYCARKNVKNYALAAWLLSLIKEGKKPNVQDLMVVETGGVKIEQQLIKKFSEIFDLLNVNANPTRTRKKRK